MSLVNMTSTPHTYEMPFLSSFLESVGAVLFLQNSKAKFNILAIGYPVMEPSIIGQFTFYLILPPTTPHASSTSGPTTTCNWLILAFRPEILLMYSCI